MSLEDLESAISRLPGEELARFSAWFEDFMAHRWDRQIEADIKAGRLDAAGNERTRISKLDAAPPFEALRLSGVLVSLSSTAGRPFEILPIRILPF
jgi:hypothetical protein